MNTIIDKSLILNKIKSHYKFSSDAEFARFIGIKPQTLSTWHNRNMFDIELMYSKCVDIDANWLLTGEGEMTKSKRVEATKEFVLKTDKREHIQQIPLYNLEAAAGLVQLFNNKQHVQEYISIPNLPKCDGAVYITGDSMYPLLKSGDIVMYKEVRDIVHGIFWGEMYLLTFEIAGDTYTMVKWLQRSEYGPDHIKLVSENQHHQPKDIPLSSIKAMAYIKASIRINSMT